MTKQPWRVLSQFLPPQSIDHQLWWNKLAPVIGSSLSRTGYDIDAQYQSLLLVHSAIIPALGPFLNHESSNMTWTDCMANSMGPLDVSVNYQNDSKCAFRITIEPVGPYAGTDSDPVNEIAAKQLLQTLSHIQQGLDFSWFDHFDPMLIKNREARQHWHAISHIPCKSQTVVGIDLHEGHFTVKPYLSPLLNAAATGGDFLQTMFNKLRTLSSPKLNLSVVEEYLSLRKDSVLAEKTYLSFDCKSPRESRIKIYTAMDMTSLEEVHELWTLGGRLSGPDIDNGFDMVSKMWNMIYPKPLAGGQLRESLTVNFNWELSPKDGSVAPKAYFLVDRDLDEHVSSALVSLFKEFGWKNHIKTHLTLEQEV
jgi:DMATS type aromatic prenyltransferase